MSVIVHAATANDLDALVALNRVVQSLHAAWYPDDFGGVFDAAAMRARFASLLDEPSHALLVAIRDGRHLGYVWIEHQVRPPSPFYVRRDRIMVHHLSVDPVARRQGIAVALFRAIEQRARAAGLTDIYLESWAENHDAHAFFAAQGFAPLKMMFRKRME